jgi:hypothetical protein
VAAREPREPGGHVTTAAAVEAALTEAHRREWARVLAATARVARDLCVASGSLSGRPVALSSSGELL